MSNTTRRIPTTATNTTVPTEPAPTTKPDVTPALPAPAKPIEIHEAISIREVAGKWRVEVVSFTGDTEPCGVDLVFESESGGLAALHADKLMKRKQFRAITGNPHPEGDTLLEVTP